MADAPRHRRALAVAAVAALLQALLMGIGVRVLLVSGDTPEDVLGPMLLWDVVAALYLVGATVLAWRQARAHGPVDVGPRLDRRAGAVVGTLLALVPAVVSLIGINAALTVLFDPKSDPDLTLLLKVAGGLMMLLSWLTLHVSYGQLYSWLYHRAGKTGLDFPATPDPVGVDFAYFALTLGSSFATSDVTVTTRQMRWYVLLHSVLSFFYNAVVMATAFKLITG